MSEVFRAGDLLNSLVELEKTGNDFYLRMSRQAKDAKSGNLFRFLAGEEAKHEKIYVDLSQECGGSTAAHADIDEEYMKFFCSLSQLQFIIYRHLHILRSAYLSTYYRDRSSATWRQTTSHPLAYL